jgi:hypothetical protein
MSRFASITSDLLARKGDAKPWLPPTAPRQTVRIEPAMEALELESAPCPAASEPHDDALTKRYALKLAPSEFERLGIIAAKQNISRQQILRHAVQDYLTRIEAQYGAQCACLAGQPCRHDGMSEPGRG